MKAFTLLSITFLAFFNPFNEARILSVLETHLSMETENNTGNWQAPSFEGILVMQGMGGAATYYIKGDKVRSEIKDEGEEAIFLYRFNGTSYTALMPSEKIYMEAPVHQLNFSDDELKEISGCEGKVTKAGEKQAIQGIACEKWVVVCGKDRSESWVTRELGFEWAQIFHPMYRAAYTGNMSQYGDMRSYFPMKIVSAPANGKPEVVMEVVRLERKKLSDDLFAIPAGYKKM